MFTINPAKIAARRFVHDTRGVYSVLFALVLVLIMLGVGLLIETGRAFSAKSDMNNALDAAVTSVARDITTGIISIDDAEAALKKFIDVNTDASMAFGDGVTIDDLFIDREAGTIEVAAHTNVDVLFPFIYPEDILKVHSQSAAAYSDRTIEIAMMLDVTGSMGGSKIRDLKTAAENAVNIMLGSNTARAERVRVALVPYAYGVNVGDTGRITESVYVEDDFKGGSAAPPKWKDYWGVGKVHLKPGDKSPRSKGTGMLPDGTTRPDYCATDRKGPSALNDDSPDQALVARDFRLNNLAENERCPNAAIVPLTADKAKLVDTIQSFTAAGYTAGHIGIQWSWYMLSNKWASFLPTGSEPAKAGTKKADKYAILMTDGEFNTAYAGNGNAYYKGGGQVHNSENRARQLCRKMKKDGIEIFTIGFQLKEKNARDLLAECASPDTSSKKHYFEASTGEALNEAFKTIARNIEQLALTK